MTTKKKTVRQVMFDLLEAAGGSRFTTHALRGKVRASHNVTRLFVMKFCERDGQVFINGRYENAYRVRKDARQESADKSREEA